VPKSSRTTPDAETAEIARDGGRGDQVDEQGFLGDLQDELVRFHGVAPQVLGDPARQAGVADAVRGQVHPDAEVVVSDLVRPRGELGTAAVECAR